MIGDMKIYILHYIIMHGEIKEISLQKDNRYDKILLGDDTNVKEKQKSLFCNDFKNEVH